MARTLCLGGAAGFWLASTWLLASPAVAAAADPSEFFGVYVGVAEAQDLGTGQILSRDMEIIIEPFDDEGFQINWVNVTKVDGRRDVPGVQRHVQRAYFEPADEQEFYVEVEPHNPFREKEETKPMLGHPVRWASVDGSRLHVYSFMVLEDGRFELQIYDRVLTDVGLDIDFRRLVDGELVRQITGTTVRAGLPTAEAE